MDRPLPPGYGPPGYGPPSYDPNDDPNDDDYRPGERLLGGLDEPPAPPQRMTNTPYRNSYQALPYNNNNNIYNNINQPPPPPSTREYSPSPTRYSRPTSYISPSSPSQFRAYDPTGGSALSNRQSWAAASDTVPMLSDPQPQSYQQPYQQWNLPSRQSNDWARPPPPASTVSYEHPTLDGSPRPGSIPPPRGPRQMSQTPLYRRSDETVVPMGEEYTDYGDEGEEDEEEEESAYTRGSVDLGTPRGRRPQPSPLHRRQTTSSYEGSFVSEQTMTAASDTTAQALEDLPEDTPATAVKTKGEHFGPAPIAPQARRGLNRQAMMTRKQVKLINGELILDCKIPSILHSFLPRRDEMEFTHMRYTAVTCDPDEFISRGYQLRQNMDPTTRETELFICITMYNEDENCFTRTMHGVMRNIAHFCSRSKSRMWGKDGWQKIVVAIVADGRKKIHPRVLDALAAIGVYQAGIAKNMVNGKPVKAHLYEYTTQVSLDSDMKFKGAEKGIVPVQMLFCLKENNSKKLNSHRWFFNAFGSSLQPNVCILLDVGTKPGPDSLYHLWKAFDTDSNVGGACGEIKAMKGKLGLSLFNPLVASQNFEYKMSNILDKPLESVFGYITVLPGALSAYRYHALQNDENGHGPLSQYFKGETLQGKDADVFTANMYLAEDRILCWELVAKRNERWVLKYVRAATGETDVPDAVPEFVSQRRRWLNGAFFAAIYSLAHFKQIWKTDHTILRKILLHSEFVYQALSLFFTFFSLANFYIMFYYIAGSLSNPETDPFGGGWGGRIFLLLKFTCILLVCTQFILCMGNRPQGAKRMFTGSMILYAIIMTYTTFCSLYIVIKSLTGGYGNQAPIELKLGDNIFTNLIVSTGSTIGVYFLMSFLYADPWHMFTSSAQYFLMLPSYICTLQVYAFCNTHDVSWGTKGDNTVSMDLGSAVATKGGQTVELEMPSEQLDIDSGYDEALRNLRDRLEVPEEPVTEMQVKEDYYRAVRTYVVVVWMVSNAVLAMVVVEIYGIGDIGGNHYLKFTLWSIAVLAVYRMLGSTAYLIIQGLHAFVEWRYKLDPSRFMDRFQPAWKRKAGLTKINSA